MHGMPVHDGIILATNGLQQPHQQLHKHGGTKSPLKDHEAEHSFVPVLGDHAATETLPSGTSQWRLSHR